MEKFYIIDHFDQNGLYLSIFPNLVHLYFFIKTMIKLYILAKNNAKKLISTEHFLA